MLLKIVLKLIQILIETTYFFVSDQILHPLSQEVHEVEYFLHPNVKNKQKINIHYRII